MSGRFKYMSLRKATAPGESPPRFLLEAQRCAYIAVAKASWIKRVAS